MSRYLFALVALATPALLAQPVGAQDSSAAVPVGRQIPVDRIVAVVGNKAILYSNVIEAVNVRRAQGLQLPADSAGQAKVMRQIVDELIDEEVLVQKAKDEHVTVADADLSATVESQIKRVRGQFTTEEEYRTELRKAGFGNPEEYRRSITDEARRSALQQQLIQKLKQDGKLVQVGVSEADVSKTYGERKADLPKRPATVTFRQIVVATKPSAAARAKARAKADSLLAEIKAGGDFALIAKRESMDPSKDQGGDLGWNRRGSMVPEFEQWMFALQPGQVSPVVETAFGFHIIKVDRVQPAEVKVRHILIRPTIDSTAIAGAQAEANAVADSLRSGAPFDSLSRRHHDPMELRGAFDPWERAQLPPEYAAALEGKKAGDITAPFRIEDPRRGAKFVIVSMLTSVEGGDYTIDDLRERIRDQLAQEKAMRRLLDQLRQSTYVSIRI
ncbi:MAG TPA: peptidylprolyl isomerase [Gemmatimonadaceae bacterium]|nr:peptidylprolyl isomerase [Gemmatimonadaceae bacterium]